MDRLWDCTSLKLTFPGRRTGGAPPGFAIQIFDLRMSLSENRFPLFRDMR
jgi:hypothetical protein